MLTPQTIRSLELILTAGCNLRCSYCYQNDKKARSMSWDTLRASLDLLFQSDRRQVQVLFIGGEPLLEYPLMKRAVMYADEARPRGMAISYTIITNGTLFEAEHADFFAAHDFEVQLSFDGVRPVQDLRGRGTFDILDRLLDRLQFERREFFRKKLRVSQTLLAQTIPWFADSVAYFLEKGVQDIRISPGITAQPDWRVERIEELDRSFAAVFDLCLRHFHRTGEVPLAVFQHGDQKSSDRAVDVEQPMCAVADAEKLAVDVDGQVLGCVTFAESYQTFPTTFLRSRLEALRMGEIVDSALIDRMAAYPAAMRASGLFHDKRTKYSSYGQCGECQYLDTCGFCPVSIGHQPGNTDPNRVPDFLCAFNLVSQKYCGRFPKMPDTADILLGRAPIPELARNLVERHVRPLTGI
jgi:radical SAM protein with 4Fe4S-binding SPASM domain